MFLEVEKLQNFKKRQITSHRIKQGTLLQYGEHARAKFLEQRLNFAGLVVFLVSESVSHVGDLLILIVLVVYANVQGEVLFMVAELTLTDLLDSITKRIC